MMERQNPNLGKLESAAWWFIPRSSFDRLRMNRRYLSRVD